LEFVFLKKDEDETKKRREGKRKLMVIRKKKKSVIIFIIGLISVFFLANHSLADVKKDIKVDLESKVIQDLSPEGLTLTFYLKIINSSSKDYYLASYDYRFIVQQAEYLKMSTSLEDLIKVPARQEIFIAWPVKVTYQHLFDTIPSLENELKAVCYLSGRLGLANRKGKLKGQVPVAFSGEFPLFKKPKARISKFKINQISIGGADIDFRVLFINENGFELLVDRIKYKILIGGHKIGEGEISGDKNLPPQGEKEFHLPLLLNFFELGREVAGFFQLAEVNCRFSAEVEIRTVWGRMTLPYNLESKVAIEK